MKIIIFLLIVVFFYMGFTRCLILNFHKVCFYSIYAIVIEKLPFLMVKPISYVIDTVKANLMKVQYKATGKTHVKENNDQ